MDEVLFPSSEHIDTDAVIPGPYAGGPGAIAPLAASPRAGSMIYNEERVPERRRPYEEIVRPRTACKKEERTYGRKDHPYR